MGSSDIIAYIGKLHDDESALTREITQITLNCENMTWSDAWSMSYIERSMVVEELSSIIRKREEARTNTKTLRASDFNKK